MTTAASQKLGRVVDLSWAPLPAPAGGGSAIMVATESGELALVEAAQITDQSSRRERCATSGPYSVYDGNYCRSNPKLCTLVIKL